MYKIKRVFEKNQQMMRTAYCETLMELAKDNPNIIALDADLVGSSGMGPFFKAYSEQSIDCGIAEANMIGIAAGLSATGKIPFAHSFGCFSSRRACDQIMISAAYAKLNVKIVGSDPGITAAYNGGTHMPFEDMGVLRSIPQITLIEPTDPAMTCDIVRQVSTLQGVHYIRLARKNVTGIYEDGSTFNIGKGNVLHSGTDVTIVASGIMIAEALNAAIKLNDQGISAAVVDMFTWKPMDNELIGQMAAATGAIVTAENHNIIGGLGAAVAEASSKTVPVPIEMVGINDMFGQVGTQDYLRTAYDLTDDAIVKASLRVIERKK